MRRVPTFQPGDRVRLTGEFLRNTGQIAGGEGQSRWTVQACPCRGCAPRTPGDPNPRSVTVLTDERREDDGMFTPEEIAAKPYLRFRHILAVNLERCR